MICLENSFELKERLEKVIDKYSVTLIKLIFTYVKSLHEAEDIAQEVFLAYFQKAPSFESKDHEKAWLIRTAINKSKNYLKSGFFKSLHPIPEDLSYLPKEEEELLDAVLKLDLKYRTPIHLYYYEGHSINEIAEILKEKSSTISTRLSRGRRILMTRLGGMFNE